MKDFDAWMREAAPPEPELPDGVREVVKVFSDGSGKYIARCRSCERDYELDLDRIEDFTQDGNYCGGSDRCLP